jgi:hypothetical protein
LQEFSHPLGWDFPLWNRASQEIGPLFSQEFLVRFLVKFEIPPKICVRCPLQPARDAHRRGIALLR